MEVEAFLEVRRVWQRLGFPFDYLVPSYATAIGSSGDTPEALAQLAGLLLNEGVRKPAVRVERLEFGAETPFQVALVRGDEATERVLRAEVAEVALRALYGVVEHGTARRLPVTLEDVAGEELRIGGKTGTGDNRRIAFDRHGRQIASNATSRTSAFVFTIGDRYFGVMLAYAAGPEAGRYQFTSALAVEVFRLLLGRIGPILGSMT
jgi:membrane peptidoglycan carboxypeptidase